MTLQAEVAGSDPLDPRRLSYEANTTQVLGQFPETGFAKGIRSVLGADGEAVASIAPDGKVHLLATDGQGNIDVDVDASVTVGSGLSCFTRYTPFGETRGGATPSNPCVAGMGTGTTANDLLYTGERRDGTTLNYQLGARTYQPGQASFLQPDQDRAAAPAAQPGIGFDPLTANTYTYVNGDPVNYRDPTGHKPECGSTADCRKWESDHDQRGKLRPQAYRGNRDAHARHVERTKIERKQKSGPLSLPPSRDDRLRLEELNREDRLWRASQQPQSNEDFNFEYMLMDIGAFLLFDDVEACQAGSTGSCLLVIAAGAPISKVGKLAKLGKVVDDAPDIENAAFAQKTFRETFGDDGPFKGRTIDDVAGSLRAGTLTPADLPIDVIVRDGNTLILNTRSAHALTRAGIPRSDWMAVNRTGDEFYEDLLTGQLTRNRLDNSGIQNPRTTGGG